MYKLTVCKVLVCALLFFLILSCQGNEQVDYHAVEALPVSDTLSAGVISLEGQTSWQNPDHILNVNDRYLIISEQRPDNFFHVFKLPELDFLYTWGSQGRGPDEFASPPMWINVSGNELIAHDMALQQQKYYEVTDTTLRKSRNPLSMSYDGQMDPLNRLRRLNDSVYIADYGLSFENTDDEHIALRPGESDPLFTFGKYPETELEDINRYPAFIKTNIAKPDGSKFAAFYIAHNRFKIYDSNGNLIKAIQVNDPFLSGEPRNDEVELLYRGTAWASDKYLYLIGYNFGGDKIFNDPDPSHNTLVEIWNWDGEPVYRGMFDRLIQKFTVSEKHNKIYAYSALNPYEIFEYDLSDILTKR